MNNKLLLIIISCLIAFLALGAFFMRNPHMPPFGGPHFEEFRDRPVMNSRWNRYGRDFCNAEFMRNRLALDDEQIKAVEELNIKFDKEYNNYNRELRPLREKLRKILKNSDPDMKKVRETLKKISEIELEIRILRISQGAAISKIIPSDKMEVLHRERRMMHGEQYHERRNMRPRDSR